MVSQDPGHIKVTVGRNIRLARDSQRLTQLQLANALDCQPMLVSKWERGNHMPSRHNMQALSEVLGQSVAWFFTDHDESPIAA